MDTHDVSTAPEYMQILLKQKQRLHEAKLLKGQHPTRTKSRDEITLQFRFRLEMSRGQANYNLRTSFVPAAYYPCQSPLSDLKKIMIKDLLLETHHRGGYLLLRSVTTPDRWTAIMAIAEDENGDVELLQLYHQEEDNNNVTEEILKEGTILLVKEPYLKVMADGGYGIRVDHRSDVIYLPAWDERIPISWQRRVTEFEISAADWKADGNDCFNSSRYQAAIACYTKGLDCLPTVEENDVLKLNRSLAFLKTRQYDAALSDLESVSTTSQRTEKALFRKTQALYDLQRYQEYNDVLKILRTHYPDNVAAEAMLTRATNRLIEQESGKYQTKQLYKEIKKIRPPHLDHSTYIGPVSVKKVDSRGRGLFTTKSVKAGDLLLCEKAFALAFVEAGKTEQTLLINAEHDSITLGAQTELIKMIVQKLYRNPSTAKVITDLHHGSYKPVDVSETDDMPVVDSFLIERIVALNGFGCPLSTRESHLRTMEDEKFQRKATDEFESCGIWPKASYINHSCYSNARRSFIGDMMIIRATRDLEPDTEITFWYHSPEVSGYDERQKKFQHWGFKCDCAMCVDDHTTKKSALIKRDRLRDELLGCFQKTMKVNVAKIETALAGIAQTYRRPAVEVPRLGLWDAQLGLTEMYSFHQQPAKAIDSGMKVLSSLGYIIEGGTLPYASSIVVKQWGLMDDRLIKCWMLLSGAYRMVAPNLERQAEEYAKLTYRICVGEDETFEETYGKLA